MSRFIRRTAPCFVALLIATTASTVSVAVLDASPASASPSVTVTWNVDAHTHLAKLGSDVTVPRGSFSGSIDLSNGQLVGNLALPPAQITLELAGAVPAADASFVIDPVGPTTGHVDFSDFHVQTSSTFDIRLAKVTPHVPSSLGPAGAMLGAGVNLVGPDCRTAKPITVAMGGTVDFVHGGTFSGTFTVPKFQHCEAMTAAINAIIPGGGNTFAATFSPPGTPAPPAPAAPAPAPFGLQAAAGPAPAGAPPPARATLGLSGLLPVDSPPGASTPLTIGGGPAGVTGQVPATPPKPNAGLLGLLFGAG